MEVEAFIKELKEVLIMNSLNVLIFIVVSFEVEGCHHSIYCVIFLKHQENLLIFMSTVMVMVSCIFRSHNPQMMGFSYLLICLLPDFLIQGNYAYFTTLELEAVGANFHITFFQFCMGPLDLNLHDPNFNVYLIIRIIGNYF